MQINTKNDRKLLDNADKWDYSNCVNKITFVGFEPAFTSSARINRETGVNPVRSRHCIREFQDIHVTGLCLKVSLGRRLGAMNLSQENCL